jgi:phage-related protein
VKRDEQIRDIKVFKTEFIRFYESQILKVQDKIDQVFTILKYQKQVPIKFFKKLNGFENLYEIRVITAFKSIRIMCFKEGDQLIILTHAFVKKSQKTPKKELNKALNLKKEYYERQID